MSTKFLVCYVLLVLIGTNGVYGQEIRFADDFEGQFTPNQSNEVYDQWYESGWSDGDGFELTQEIPARDGDQSIKTIMRRNPGGRSRSEIGLNLDASLGDYWYGFSFYIPENPDLSSLTADNDVFVVLAQWGVWANNPGLPDFALRMTDDEFLVTYEPGPQVPITMWQGPLVQGEWVDWVFHIKWSKTDNGAIEVFQNGEKVYDRYNFQSTDGDGDDVKSKIGLYWSNWGNFTSNSEELLAYYDEFAVASAFDGYLLVAPGLDASECDGNSSPVIDFVEPQSNLALPLDYQELNVTLNATDDDSGIKSVHLYLDERLIEILDTPPFEFQSSTFPDLLGLSEGNHLLQAIATDSCGASVETEIINVRVGNPTGEVGYEGFEQVVSMEAENGVFDNAWIANNDNTASSFQFIETKSSFSQDGDEPACDDLTCMSTFNFSVDSEVNYRFWYRSLPSENNSSFYWKIDDANWQKEAWDGSGDWFSTDAPQVDNLSTGAHVLTIAHGLAGTRLDKFVIQSDEFEAPTSFGPLETLIGGPLTLVDSIFLEAESGVVEAPMLIVSEDPTASGDSYVYTPPGARTTGEIPAMGKVTFNVSLTEGIYRIWARLIALDGTSDSYYVQVDDGPIYTWNAIQQSSEWIWDAVHDDNEDGDPVVDFDLRAGEHTITFYHREDDMKLDQIYITQLGDDPGNPDGDGDGIPDDDDLCPNTPSGENVDTDGCSESQKDDDGDGVFNNADQCSETPTNAEVDDDGCADSQKDSDGDGVTNDIDKCTDTAEGESVDDTGCLLLSVASANPKLGIYPNPNSGLFNLQTSMKGNVRLQLFNLDGRRLLQSDATVIDNYVQIDVRSLSLLSGIYMLEIQQEDGSVKRLKMIFE